MNWHIPIMPRSSDPDVIVRNIQEAGRLDPMGLAAASRTVIHINKKEVLQ